MIEIVAELSANHCGNKFIALKTIEAAHKAGATMIKAQAFTPENIAAPGLIIKKGPWKGMSYFDLYKQAMTPFEWFPELKELTESLGMEFFASAFDRESVDMLEKLGVRRHKVASFEITDFGLIDYMLSTKKPLIISTGIADMGDIENLREHLGLEVYNNVTFLVCTSAYPTPPIQVCIGRMANFKKVGLSDHTKGFLVPVMATCYNPVLIEKHLMLHEYIDSPDSHFSMTPDEFAEMVEAVRTAEKMHSDQYPEVDRSFARSLWVVKNMKKGEKFTRKNIKSLRPNHGLHPNHLLQVLGRVAKKNIKAPCPLSLNCY